MILNYLNYISRNDNRDLSKEEAMNGYIAETKLVSFCFCQTK
jgi:hypothetical protein